MDIQDLADIVGIDVVEVAMAERGIGLTHYDTVAAMASVLDLEPEDLYPTLAEHFQAIEMAEDEDTVRAQMLAPDRSAAFLMAGIDPDLEFWYAIVKLKSGNERRYRVSSVERGRMREELASMDTTEGWLLFMADCRSVAVRSSAIAEVHFTDTASYAPFSSRESAFKIVIVSPRSPRPETIKVSPDGGVDGEGPRPFAAFLEAAREGRATMRFLVLEDGAEESFVGIDMLELMEVPLGVLLPDLYADEIVIRPPDAAADLEGMEIMGRA